MWKRRWIVVAFSCNLAALIVICLQLEEQINNQIILSWENKKNIISLSSAEFAYRLVYNSTIKKV